MTTLASRTIEALRDEHDALADLVPSLTAEQLNGPSGASEWSVAQVLSHLGSGSQISLASLQTALGQRDAPDDGFNRSVWDRWDAMAPDEQRAGFLEHNAILVAALEALTAEQHASLEVPVGFLPRPLSVAGFGGLRLNEVAHHSWDVRVAVDPAAGLRALSAATLPDHLAGDLGFMLRFVGKADRIDTYVALRIGDSGYTIVIADEATLVADRTEPTATFSGPVEAGLRLISGRLGATFTPASVAVTGNVTLDELRAVFPGF